MPRGKKNSVAKDASMAPSPKSTRSSRRGKNVEIPSVSKSNVSSGQKDIESKMKSGASKKKSTPKNSVSKKNKVTTTAISTSDDVITPKSRASVKNKIQEKKSKSASVETPASICDQTSVRKSARAKKETNKFSEWKEKGSKSQKKDAELGKSNNMAAGHGLDIVDVYTRGVRHTTEDIGTCLWDFSRFTWKLYTTKIDNTSSL